MGLFGRRPAGQSLLGFDPGIRYRVVDPAGQGLTGVPLVPVIGVSG